MAIRNTRSPKSVGFFGRGILVALEHHLLASHSVLQEEKARHTATYPGYKYQPRRKGVKKAAASVSGVGQQSGTSYEDYSLCEKCGKRSLTTPQTPSTPFTPSTSSSASSSNPRYFLPPPPQTPTSIVNLPSLPKARYTPSSPDDRPTDVDSKRRRTASYTPFYDQDTLYSDTPRRSAPLMAPPPRPHDPSLTLAPIQTASNISHPLPSSGVAALATVAANAVREPSHSQARSVEAMVMSISLSSKMRALRVISPPLRNPGPSSPVQTVRGAVVAIESENQSSIQHLTHYLVETFNATGEYALQTINGPHEASFGSGSGEPRPREIVDYLTVVSEWHSISKSVVDYITTPPSTYSLKEGEQQQHNEPPKIPIALIPHFALSTTNTFASSIPITDSYAPVDHWSWVATMWRGIVGADATVCVRRCDREEKDRAGEVEVKTDYGAVFWRICEDDSENERERGRRRVAFEVGELVRSVARLG